MCRTGPMAFTEAQSSSVNAIGDHTQALPSESRTTAIRVGYGIPKNDTMGPSATYIDGPNSASMSTSLHL